MSDGAAPREPREQTIEQLDNATVLQNPVEGVDYLPDVPVVIRGQVPVIELGANGVPAFRTISITSPGDPVEILSGDPTRVRALILVQLGTLIVGTRRGDLQSGSGPNAAQIPQNVPIELRTQARVFGFPNAAGTVVVTVIEERTAG